MKEKNFDPNKGHSYYQRRSRSSVSRSFSGRSATRSYSFSR
ncbi:hypothetical protein CLNEO_01080 [Anaerotignum neopropionicum]|uniref:Uncharacterized protein n=1 Tax=Anaerotignum neopropionicum TaxID=36847 RepID=A0A136WHJ6_9FIRM|nr:hypothetical protein CLNEO_01080 [Anaerotignum neopropionicum]